jgi:hypothetical protein
MTTFTRDDEDALIVEEIQSLHQEKRTALKVIRIGIAVVLAQIAAAGYIFSAFRHHAFFQAKGGMDILAALGVALLGIAITLVFGALLHIRRLDRKIATFNRRRGSRGRN